MNIIQIKCDYCNQNFEKSLSQYKQCLKRGRKFHFCSVECSNKHQTKKFKDFQCLGCKKTFSSKNERKYCSRTCSNKNRSKKLKETNCCKCGKFLKFGFSVKKLCDKCNSNYRDWNNITLRDLRSKYDLNQYHARIRSLARASFNKSNTNKICFNCGYSKHYEVCHIKDIKDFDLDTPISTVNSETNLIALCPNCHWEFDNKILSLS